jgi:enoyl-CoA hydratase
MEILMTIQAHLENNIGIITLDRPKALNAINWELLTQLEKKLEQWQTESLRALIITGAGKAFAAGADIKQMSSFGAVDAHAFASAGQRILRKIEHFPAPTIAAVNGFALGGGCELAMCCDIILAGAKAKFGQPEVNLGVIPGFGGTQRLVRRVGRQAALELMMTGRIVGAGEAVQLGIALREAEGDVLEEAKALANNIAKKGPVAVRYVKQAVDATDRLDLDAGLAMEASLFGLCFASSDQKEGMQAFMEKRKAQFEGK